MARADRITAADVLYTWGDASGVAEACMFESRLHAPPGLAIFAACAWYRETAPEPGDMGDACEARCRCCGEPWPCSDSARTDIRPDIRATHHL